MKSRLAIVIVLLMSLVIGCSSNKASNSDISGEGYVFEINDDRILVLNNADAEDFGRSWNDIFETYEGEAIWLMTNTSKVDVGQKVKYWVDGAVDDSFPQQASAKQIEIVE